MLIYSALALDFVLRARLAPDSRPAALLASRLIRVLVWFVALASLAIIIRGVYCTVELAQGWHGCTITHEVFTLVLDVSDHSPFDSWRDSRQGADLLLTTTLQDIPMVFCMAFLLPAHPYLGLQRSGVWAAQEAKGEKEKPILQGGCEMSS